MKLESVPIARRRSYPPRVSAFTEPFWSGLREGKWQSTCCRACDRFTFPPKPVCPHCWSDDVVWKELCARGTLYSWTRIHAAPEAFADEVPYTVCIVDLDIGLRIAARLLEWPGASFTPGIPMEMVVLNFEDGPLFAARPVPPSSSNSDAP